MRTDNSLKILFFINFAVSLGFAVSDAYFSVYVTGLGARGLVFASAIGLYAAAKILFSPLAGMLSDRLGSRRLIIFSITIYSLIAFLYMQSNNLLIVTALRTAQGLSTAIFRPVLLSAAGSAAPRGRRASSLGGFDISFYSAAALGPLLGGLVKDHFGFTGLFGVLFVLCVSALIAAVFLPSGAGVNSIPERCAPLKDIAGNSVIASLLFFIFGRAYSIATMCVFLPIFMESRMGSTGFQTGMVLSSTTLSMILFLRPMGRMADRISRKLMIVGGGVYASALVFMVADTGSFYGMLFLCVCAGIFGAVSQPASSSLLVDEGERLGMGRTAGLFNSVMNLGFTAASFIGALIISVLDIRVVFYTAGAVGMVSVLACLLLMSAVPSAEADIKTI
ncbi:MAG: MFS transporter [Deferribacterales bacterium]